jgi:hypothetical protein
MKNTLVVVADLAGLKAYRLDETPVQHTSRLELLQEFNNNGAKARRADVATDASGRFPRGAAQGASGMSDGERHSLELENRKRLVRQLAGNLSQLLQRGAVDDCYLAASREIHNRLLDELEPAARAMIVRSVRADLTKLDPSQVLTHF